MKFLNIANNNLTGCFDSLAIALCSKFSSSYFRADSLIDKGNNFDSSWDFFCTYQTCDTTSTNIFNHLFVESVSIFPNLASSFIFIDVPQSASNASYKIYNLNGKLMKSARLSYHKKIDIEVLKTGSYFIELIDGRKTYRAKFLKL